jgi:hypothetical protein
MVMKDGFAKAAILQPCSRAGAAGDNYFTESKNLATLSPLVSIFITFREPA